MARNALLGIVLSVFGVTGCVSDFNRVEARNGITFYCPGAGNIDFGDSGVREGLRKAGYNGQVATVMWTVGFNPALDQVLRLNAHAGAKSLADKIRDYSREFPDRQIDLIGLSAGSGVAVWALEDLKGDVKVDNVILLSSSLYHQYDVSRALKSVNGKIYCYYSPHDAILWGPMKVFGTIDGIPGVDGVGAVGLHSPHGSERVVNIEWRPEFSRYGYNGGHVDSTSPEFVRVFLSPYIIHGEARPTAVATEPETAPPAAHADQPPRARAVAADQLSDRAASQ